MKNKLLAVLAALIVAPVFAVGAQAEIPTVLKGFGGSHSPSICDNLFDGYMTNVGAMP